MLAVAAALGPSVLLLDEPTSGCDPLSARRVEGALAGCGAAAVWVTHDAEQPARVGGRLLELPTGEDNDFLCFLRVLVVVLRRWLVPAVWRCLSAVYSILKPTCMVTIQDGARVCVW